MIDWATIIAERNEWVERNFPNSPPTHSVLGVIEEVGELAHAHLKAAQNIRGSQEEHNAKARDALGDIVVYLLGVIANNGVRTDHIYIPQTHLHDADYALLMLAAQAGSLARTQAHPVSASSAWWTLKVVKILGYADKYANARGWDLWEIVQSTWDHVKQRDWNAHREAGSKAHDPSVSDPYVLPMDEPSID